MKRSIRIKHAIVAGLFASAVATAIGLVSRDDGHAAAQPALPSISLTPSAASGDVIADVAERVVASVVNVSTTQIVDDGPYMIDPFFNDPTSPQFGAQDPRKAQSLGSGVVVSTDGKILTNAHVVKNADEIVVTLHDGAEVVAKVVGIDPRSDLAVLQLQGKHPGLRPLPFADTTKTRLGEVVLAIGNPFGVGQAVTMGIVSATGRASVGIADYEDFIQTDAAINPGNSGGALVNLKGELVGINTAILSRTGGYQGIGFAIPTAMARPIMDMLIKDGKVARGWLGVGLAPLDAQHASRLKNSGKGVLVAGVEPGAPAERAGLSAGDVITAIDGTEVSDVGKLRNLVAMKGVGKATTLAILRDGKPQALKVTLGELPEQQLRPQQRRVRIR